MWSFFKRLFRIFRAESNALLDKFEEPIKMTKQGIRELEVQLDESLKSFAEIKAMAIRSKREVQVYKEKTADYESKAMMLLKQGQEGKMDAAEADRLASEALALREQNSKLAQTAVGNQQRYDKMVDNMDGKIKRLKSELAKWKNELKSLEARYKAAKAGEKINKAMAGVDSTETLRMLEKTRNQVEEAEALSEAYGEMIDESKSVDQEINDALDNTGQSDALLEMKRKLGMLPAAEEKQEIKIEQKEVIKLDNNDDANNA
ncbi:MAG: PspA/IM30 family protein [Aureispira sp.]|nr:PspA/IM30 family protein [Aureispira sp.]